MNNNEVTSTRDTIRTSEVLEKVESYAVAIQEALSFLESAIGPIICPSKPELATAIDPEPYRRSPFTDRLMDLHSKLIAIKEKINDLTDSVTL